MSHAHYPGRGVYTGPGSGYSIGSVTNAPYTSAPPPSTKTLARDPRTPAMHFADPTPRPAFVKPTTQTAFPNVARYTTLPQDGSLLSSDLWSRPPEQGGAVLVDTFIGHRGRAVFVYGDPRNGTLLYLGGPVQRYGV